jgi:hypothetical protein
MKNLLFCVALAGCGHKQPTNVSNEGSGAGSAVTAPADTRTEIEKRRDGACETLGPKITSCAVEDAKKDLAAGKIKQKDFDANTAPAILKKNTEEFIKTCKKSDFSSRQVRVLEVCQQEESQCEPLLSCLDNLNKK